MAKELLIIPITNTVERAIMPFIFVLTKRMTADADNTKIITMLINAIDFNSCSKACKKQAAKLRKKDQMRNQLTEEVAWCWVLAL